MSEPTKRETCRHLYTVAQSWRQPALTGEDPRYQLAISMIADIANWALHPNWGTAPPYVERAVISSKSPK